MRSYTSDICNELLLRTRLILFRSSLEPSNTKGWFGVWGLSDFRLYLCVMLENHAVLLFLLNAFCTCCWRMIAILHSCCMKILMIDDSTVMLVSVGSSRQHFATLRFLHLSKVTAIPHVFSPSTTCSLLWIIHTMVVIIKGMLAWYDTEFFGPSWHVVCAAVHWSNSCGTHIWHVTALFLAALDCVPQSTSNLMPSHLGHLWQRHGSDQALYNIRHHLLIVTIPCSCCTATCGCPHCISFTSALGLPLTCCFKAAHVGFATGHRFLLQLLQYQLAFLDQCRYDH